MATVQVADERAFSSLRVNERQRKPRTEGITEIRGPYYTPMGRHCLEDVLDTIRRRVLHTDAASCGWGND
jgi:phosphosulfolactate synthase (CoM biosynthesis protein A)